MHAPASIYTNSRAVGEFLIEFDEAVALYDKKSFRQSFVSISTSLYYTIVVAPKFNSYVSCYKG